MKVWVVRNDDREIAGVFDSYDGACLFASLTGMNPHRISEFEVLSLKQAGDANG